MCGLPHLLCRNYVWWPEDVCPLLPDMIISKDLLRPLREQWYDNFRKPFTSIAVTGKPRGHFFFTSSLDCSFDLIGWWFVSKILHQLLLQLCLLWITYCDTFIPDSETMKTCINSWRFITSRCWSLFFFFCSFSVRKYDNCHFAARRRCWGHGYDRVLSWNASLSPRICTLLRTCTRLWTQIAGPSQ